jgi:hypothetical protein
VVNVQNKPNQDYAPVLLQTYIQLVGNVEAGFWLLAAGGALALDKASLDRRSQSCTLQVLLLLTACIQSLLYCCTPPTCTIALQSVRVPSCTGVAFRERPTNRYTAGSTCKAAQLTPQFSTTRP